MSTLSDNWIDENKLVSPERAHAIGLVTMYWNFVETGIRSILTHYSGMSKVDGARFTYPMRVPSMSTTIRSFIKYKETDKDVIELIYYGLKVADICRINRNVLSHSWTNFSGDKLFFEKMTKEEPQTQVFEFSLSDIRRVADEIFECGHFFMFVALYLSALGDVYRQQVLPQKPVLPQRLLSIDQYGPEEEM